MADRRRVTFIVAVGELKLAFALLGSDMQAADVQVKRI